MFSSDRQNLNRSVIQGRGHNVAQQRTSNRNNFIARLKALRIKEFDKYRQIDEDQLDYQCLIEIKQLLLAGTNSKNLLCPQEVMSVLEDVQHEIEAFEVEQCEKELLKEPEDIANNLMNVCTICNSLIIQGDICETCSKIDFTSHF